MATAPITQLLSDLNAGDPKAYDRLVPLIYEELRVIAKRYRASEHNADTLNTTALVHEAFLKLTGQREVSWKNRSHFFGIAAQAMRRILVDYARQKRAQRRGGGHEKVDFDENRIGAAMRPESLLALDEALEQLAAFDPRMARIVEYRFFTGLKIEEVADMLEISTATVNRDWALAKAWLHRAMTRNAA